MVKTITENGALFAAHHNASPARTVSNPFKTVLRFYDERLRQLRRLERHERWNLFRLRIVRWFSPDQITVDEYVRSRPWPRPPKPIDP